MKKPLTPTEDVSFTPIKAGFPNPAEDARSTGLDLNELVVRHPISTFYLRVEGQAVPDGRVQNGDIVVVDKSLEPKHGDLVVCVVEGEFMLRYLKREATKAWLIGDNTPIALHTNDTDATMWGVVTFVIHKQR